MQPFLLIFENNYNLLMKHNLFYLIQFEFSNILLIDNYIIKIWFL